MFKNVCMMAGCFSLFFSVCHAEKVIWSGKVQSDGTPTRAIPLVLHQQYQVKVSGIVNLGKWKQGGKALANDACFEYIPGEKDLDNETISKLVSLRNSNDISICDGKFHPDHKYQSEPFSAKQNKIHFWVYDIDYSDNHGAFDVEIVEVPLK